MTLVLIWVDELAIADALWKEALVEGVDMRCSRFPIWKEALEKMESLPVACDFTGVEP